MSNHTLKSQQIMVENENKVNYTGKKWSYLRLWHVIFQYLFTFCTF